MSILVSHSLLLEKLSLLRFGDEVMSWVRSFLVGRSLSVMVDGVGSSERAVGSGVPQGSVLDPVLFLLYVNCIARDTSSFWVAFADDFKLGIAHRRGNDRDGNGLRLQQDLDRLSATSKSWNLKLNKEKCVVMRFGGGTPGEEVGPMNRIDEAELKVVAAYKDLGVVIDNRLRFHTHVGMVVGRAGALMGDLLRSTVCRSKKFMVTLYISHIRPYMDYCSSVWNVGYLGDARRLESVQRRWTREIAGMAEMVYERRLRELQLYSVAGRLLRADLVKIWKLVRLGSHESLRELFQVSRLENARGHSLRLIMPRCRTEVMRRTLMARRVQVWNALDAAVVEVNSLECFKRRLDGAISSEFYRVN